MYLLRENKTITKESSWWDLLTGWEEVTKGMSLEALQKHAVALSQDGVVYDIVSAERPEERLWISDPSAFYHCAKKSTTPSVYFDTDGTLCYWYPDGRGFAYPEQILDPAVHYYRDLEAHHFVIELAKHLAKSGLDVCLLGAADYKTIPDKVAWYRQFLSFIPKENIFFCPIGASKAEYGKQNPEISVLIDDYHKNLDEWEAAGGIAVKLVTDQNTKDTTRFCVSCLPNEQASGSNLYYEVSRCGVYVKALPGKSWLLANGLWKDEEKGTIVLPNKAVSDLLLRGGRKTVSLDQSGTCPVRLFETETKSGATRVFMEVDLPEGTRVIPLSAKEQKALLKSEVPVIPKPKTIEPDLTER